MIGIADMPAFDGQGLLGSVGIEDLRCLPIAQELPAAKYAKKTSPNPISSSQSSFLKNCIRGGSSPRFCCRTCFHSAVANAWRVLLVAVRAVALVPSIAVRSEFGTVGFGRMHALHTLQQWVMSCIFLGLVSSIFNYSGIFIIIHDCNIFSKVEWSFHGPLSIPTGECLVSEKSNPEINAFRRNTLVN